MTDPSAPPPQRIGDAERDRAVSYLRDHLAEGRLDSEEFDDRLTRALTARTQADLDPLFVDLPGPRPGQAVQPAGRQAVPPVEGTQQVEPRPASAGPSERPGAAAVVSAVIWPLAIVLCFVTHWQFWWLMLIPVFVSSALGRLQHQQHRDRGRDRGRYRH